MVLSYVKMTHKTHSQTEGGDNSENIDAGAYSVRGTAVLRFANGIHDPVRVYTDP